MLLSADDERVLVTGSGGRSSGIKCDSERLRAFLTSTLGLDLGVLLTDRYQFLCDLINAFHQHEPFQDLTHTGVPFSERREPTIEECLESVFREEGGMCWTLNGAMHVILAQLGYRPDGILGAVGRPTRPQHMMNLVRDLRSPGDVYLVDVGMASRPHGLIPMDFAGCVSPVYRVHDQKLRWVRNRCDDGGETIVRQDEFIPTLGARYSGRVDRTGEWEDAIYFSLTPKPVDEIRQTIAKNIYCVRNSIFNVTRRITVTHREVGKYVAILNDKLLIETQGPVFSKTRLNTMEEILEAIRKYFPKFPQEVARASYEEWFKVDQFVARDKS